MLYFFIFKTSTVVFLWLTPESMSAIKKNNYHLQIQVKKILEVYEIWKSTLQKLFIHFLKTQIYVKEKLKRCQR